MKARVNQADNITDTEILVNQDNQVQEDDVIEQDLTPWQKLYAEYKSKTEVLKTKYSPLLNKEILSKQSQDPYSLANIFKDIANENIVLARASNTNKSLKLQYYNDSAIACHYGLSIVEKANCNNDLRLRELEEEICKYLNDIQTDMVSACGGRLELLPGINNKADLSNVSKSEIIEQLRTKTKEQLKNIEAAKAVKDDSAYIELTSNVFKGIASEMENYVATLYKDAEAILGPPPCDYTVIGLGSMALRQMTPYSDLEFAILTDNDNYKQSKDFTIREYFRNLTHLVHFKVINLGETIIPTSAYNINLATFIRQAVNFDLGGKTPLDRIEKDKPYELIQTVEGMINYLKNEDNKTLNMDKNLLFILQKSCPIYQHGEKNLAAKYQNQAQEFLLSIDTTNNRPYYENRAVQILSKEGVEIDYTKQVPQVHQTSGNLKQFSFNANKAPGKLFDVKQEIYRMPDRFIYNLGFIHGVQEESGWDTIGKLCDKGIINSEAAFNLKKVLSFATNLRLKAYSHYGYQKDTMDFAKTYEGKADLQANEVERELTTVFKLSHKDLEQEGALFEYYYTALALRNSLEEFCKLDDSNQKEGFFNNNPFYQEAVGTKAQINLRLLRYKDALKYQLEELEIKKQDLIDDHSNLIQIDLEIATSFNNIGYTYRALGDPHKALECMKEALETWQKFLVDDPLSVATSFNNIGVTYGALGDHHKALNYKTQALEICQKSLGNNHPSVAASFNNIGVTYGKLGDPRKALEYHTKALEIRKKSLGDNHREVAESLGNTGMIYGVLGDHHKALDYKTQGLEIRKKSLGDDYRDVAISLNSIGMTYEDLGDHHKALEYMIQSLEIREKSLVDNHQDVALCLNNIGSTYGKLGDYLKALEYHTKALEIREKSLGTHQDVAASLNDIGYTYGKLGDPHKALEYHTKALEIWQISLGNDHPDVAASFNNIGVTYGVLGDHKEALKYMKEALEIWQKSLVDNHQKLALCLNNIGSTYGKLGDHHKALEYHIKALEIWQKSLGTEHPDVAISLNNIAYTYGVLGNHYKALKYTKEALVIWQKSEESEKILQCQKNIDNILSILKTNSSFEDMPEKADGAVRVISYNITADFFDNKDTTADQRHHWKYRAPFVKVLIKKLYPDIMCLQELSAEQALELHQYFNKEGGYNSIFLSQTPSEVETGEISWGEEVREWGKKYLGASLIGTFINKSFKFVETGRFWLNENPDLVPTITDRGEVDKGFGNMNTYRAVLWAKVQLEDNTSLYIFNSHYPLNRNNETRFKCAQLEMNKIQEIAEGNAWISVGDRNLIPTKDDNEQYNPHTVYDELTRHGKNIIQDSDNHYGPITTWIGFTYDEYKNEINASGEFADPNKLDVIVSNLDSSSSFHHHGAFDPVEFRLLSLTDPLTQEHNKQRYFASDHALIGADLVLDNNP